MERALPLIVRLYEIVDELERLFPGRRFTPDGHMVGGIGEVWAEWMFGVELLPASTERHDARSGNGRLVQIKATQGKSVSLYDEPEHLIVLKLLRSGKAEVIYNGPGAVPWQSAGAKGKNGQRPIALMKLLTIDKTVVDGDRLPVVNKPL